MDDAPLYRLKQTLQPHAHHTYHNFPVAMSNYMSGYQLQSIQGPSDAGLKNNSIEGYTQVSRIGEVVVNAFVDTYEYASVPDSFTVAEITGEAYMGDNNELVKIDANAAALTPAQTTPVENRPHFYEWATCTTGMIAVTRRMRSTFRNYVAAETACPVVACAACRGPLDEVDYQFAGIVRSNCIRSMDDGVGENTLSRVVVFCRELCPLCRTDDRRVLHFGNWWHVYDSQQQRWGGPPGRYDCLDVCFRERRIQKQEPRPKTTASHRGESHPSRIPFPLNLHTFNCMTNDKPLTRLYSTLGFVATSSRLFRRERNWTCNHVCEERRSP